MENAGATKYGKPSEENTLKYETKYQLPCRPSSANQFLRAVSHAVGSEKMLSESYSDADDDYITLHFFNVA